MRFRGSNTLQPSYSNSKFEPRQRYFDLDGASCNLDGASCHLDGASCDGTRRARELATFI